MRLIYFVVDADQQIERVPRDVVEELWDGHCTSEALPCEVEQEFRLVSVLINEELTPIVCFFVHLDIEHGQITQESKVQAFQAMSIRKRRRYDHPAARRQFSGWPPDWQSQLAVALDVPAQQLQKIGIGGPLLMSDLWGIPLDKVIGYFEQASEEE